jgi:tRNA dimethylallyltransferase
VKRETCIVIVGPTAVGKTSFAIEIARHFNTEIISADSRQCYTELNIGVAKPSQQQLREVRHYFINSHSIHEDVNAKVFEAYALQSSEEIFSSHHVAVMTGGTGLYIKAFCEGLDEIPTIDTGIREEIISSYKTKGITWLQNEIRQHDPQFFSVGEIQNPQRLMRALEVKLSTGRSVLDFHTRQKIERSFSIIKLGLYLPTKELYAHINKRVDDMMRDGLADEARNLYSFKNLNALQTVGYKELFDHFDGKISLEEAVEQIKTNTRHFAKRQMTWFRRDMEIRWLDNSKPVDWKTILHKITPSPDQ